MNEGVWQICPVWRIWRGSGGSCRKSLWRVARQKQTRQDM